MGSLLRGWSLVGSMSVQLRRGNTRIIWSPKKPGRVFCSAGIAATHTQLAALSQLTMHHYEPKTRETIFSFRGENNQEVYLCADFPNSGAVRLPMEWRNEQWQVGVTLPAGMYAYQFEVNGQRARDKSVQGTVNPTHAKSGRNCWSLAVVPNWLKKANA